MGCRIFYNGIKDIIVVSDLKDKQQVYIIYIGTLLSFIFSIVVTYLNTKYLTLEDFGVFKLYQNAGYLLYVILNLGIFYSSTYLVAQSDDLSEQVKLASAGLNVFFIVCFVLFIVMSFLYFLFWDVFAKYFRDGFFLLFLSFFSVALINGMQGIYQGMNKIKEISIIKFMPYFLFTICFILFSVDSSFSSITLFCMLNILVVTFYLINTGFNFFSLDSTKSIILSVRSYGLNVYIGSVLGVGCIYFINTMLPFYLDMKALAVVGVALTLSSPLQLIPSVIGVVLFRKFANGNNCFDKDVVIPLTIISVIAIIVFNLLISSVVSILFSEEYMGAIELSRLISLGYIFYGVGDFFTKFIASRGAGKSLRNTSVAVGLSVIAVFFLTINNFGPHALCYAVIFGGLVFSFLSISACYKIIREENDIK